MNNLSLDVRILKYLGWLAPVLLIIGVTAGLVAGSWGPVPLGFLIVGGVLLLAWLLAEWRSLPGFLGRRSTQAGTNAVISTLAVVVILGLINVLAVRYVQRIDLTENQIFTLAPQTQEVLENLDQPVNVWVFWDSDTPPNGLDQELLDNYRRESDQFSYDYVDPQVELNLAREFGVQSLGEVYLEMGDSRRLLQNVSPQQRLSERQLTNAIVQGTSDRQPVAYFVQGHGERPLEPGQGGLSEAVSLLEGENYQVEMLNLAEAGSVPDDASVVILAGPERELLEGEVEALQAYLLSKSGLMLLVDPDKDPGLTPLLDDWGVQLSDLLVIDPNGQALGLGFTTPLVQTYGDHPITQEFGSGISFYPESQVVELEPEPPADVETAPLIITNEQTQAAVIPESGDIELDPEVDIQGPLVLGVALDRPVEPEPVEPEPVEPEPVEAEPDAEGDAAETPDEDTSDAEADADSPDEESPEAENPEARLVVIGNSSFIINGLVSQQLNGDVFLNSVSWLSQQDDQSLAIRPREVTNRRLILDTQQWIVVSLTAVVILPILAFGGAIALWFKRR